MIEARHIGQLFSVMRASYGHLWPHDSAEDVQIWLRKLGGYSHNDVMRAADRMTREYPKHPPTLGQFDAAVGGPPQRANTYLPPPQSTKQRVIANKTMLNVVLSAGGVKQFTLELMVKLKNALSQEWTDDVTQAQVKTLHDELWGLVNNQSAQTGQSDE